MTATSLLIAVHLCRALRVILFILVEQHLEPRIEEISAQQLLHSGFSTSTGQTDID